MKAEELFGVLKAALADEWASDEAFDGVGEMFSAARRLKLDREQLEQEDSWGQENPTLKAMFDSASQSTEWPSHPAEVRISVMWDVVQRSLADLGASSKDVTVRGLRTRRMEASILPADDGPLILLDLALHHLVGFFIQMVLASSSLPFDTIGGLPVGPPLLDRDTAVRAGRATCGALRWTGDVGLVVGVALREPLASLELELLELTEQFVLAHEYAHARLGHLDSGDAVTRSRLGFGPVDTTALVPNWLPELQADQFAARLLMHGVDQASIVIRLLAMRIALSVMDLATSSRYVVTQVTHPSAALRYRSIVAGLFGENLHPAIGFVEEIVDDYFDQVSSFDDMPEVAEDPLAARLSAVPEIFAPFGDGLDAMTTWEFWGWSASTPAEISLMLWADRCIIRLGEEAARNAASLAFSFASESGSVPWLESFMAIGFASFEREVFAKLDAATVAELRTEGTTFSDLRGALEAVLGSDWDAISQAIPPLAMWRQQISGVPELVRPELLARARAILAASYREV